MLLLLNDSMGFSFVAYSLLIPLVLLEGLTETKWEKKKKKEPMNFKYAKLSSKGSRACNQKHGMSSYNV